MLLFLFRISDKSKAIKTNLFFISAKLFGNTQDRQAVSPARIFFSKFNELPVWLFEQFESEPIELLKLTIHSLLLLDDLLGRTMFKIIKYL